VEVIVPPVIGEVVAMLVTVPVLPGAMFLVLTGVMVKTTLAVPLVYAEAHMMNEVAPARSTVWYPPVVVIVLCWVVDP
jgi:hypothetical protein